MSPGKIATATVIPITAISSRKGSATTAPAAASVDASAIAIAIPVTPFSGDSLAPPGKRACRTSAHGARMRGASDLNWIRRRALQHPSPS